MKKLVVMFLALGSISFILYSHSSSLFDSDPADYNQLLVGTWKLYSEQHVNDSSVVIKSTTTYHDDGTERSNAVLHVSSGIQKISGSSKVRSMATWEIEENKILEATQFIDFYEYSGSVALRDYFDNLERENKDFLKVVKEYEIRMLTKDELVVMDHKGATRSYKREVARR